MPQGNDFEPPKYLAALIGAINDGGKSVQASALALTLVGLYLAATAFSATDEDLLLGHTTPVAQLGIQLPVGFSFAIAPIVFVLLHIYLLVRCDMLAANVRQFRIDLRAMVPIEADRERTRELLANVEFIYAIAVPRGSALRSGLYRLVVWLLAAAFPLLVLWLVQVSALRDQSALITGTQRVLLGIDLLALVRYFHRNGRWRSEAPVPPRDSPGLARRLALAVFVMWLNLQYVNVPGPDATTVGSHAAPDWNAVADTPLDVLCGQIGWGCRYLDVSHRPLFSRVWDNRALIDLRLGKFRQDVRAALEGDVLRGRSLLFADLSQSDLFGADLRNTDLRRADLSDTRLQGADMSFADLRGADLSRAHAQGAHLFSALLQSADLSFASLTGADLDSANLTSATLSYAQMSGASLRDATLWGAELVGVTLQGADLRGANLQLADLVGTQLVGAQLTCSAPLGASFRGAMVLGGPLTPEQRAAVAPLLRQNSACTRLSHVQVNQFTNFALANLKGTDFDTPLTNDEKREVLFYLWRWLPLSHEELNIVAAVRFGLRLDDGTRVSLASGFRAAPGPTLVDDPTPKALADVDAKSLTHDESGYWTALSDWLLTDPAAQAEPAIQQRVEGVFADEMLARRKLSELPPAVIQVACRFMDAAREKTLLLGESELGRLRSLAGRCAPAEQIGTGK